MIRPNVTEMFLRINLTAVALAMRNQQRRKGKSRKSQSSDHDTIACEHFFADCTSQTKENIFSEQMLFYTFCHELKSHDYDCDDGLCSLPFCFFGA